jgi:hypothetical protein
MSDLTTLSAVKTYLGGSIQVGEDVVLQQMITAYSAAVCSYTNRGLISQAYDIRRSGRGQFAMQFPQYPVTAVSLVEIDGVALASQSSFGSYGYRFDDMSIIADGISFGRGRSNIHLVFTAGYTVIPADLAEVVAEMVGMRYKLRANIGIQSKTLAGEVITYSAKDFPPGVTMVIDSYKNIVPL